jgi:hypothetical protein
LEAASFGAALFATVAPLQMQVMAQAEDAPVLASAFNIAAFNLGNAIGAWAGAAARRRTARLAMDRCRHLRCRPDAGVAARAIRASAPGFAPIRLTIAARPIPD